MTDPASKSLGKKPAAKPKTVTKLSTVKGLSITHGPMGHDALGRETEPAWVAVENAKGERVIIFGGEK